MELSKIYNPNLTNHLTEIRSKKVSDGSRIILNPHTAELEILMGEMIKKKIMAKDRVLRELESYIAENREADNELEQLKTNYLRLGNEQNALTLELEQLKATYIRTKEHKKIEQESLKTQISHIESLINRRDVEHRAMIDRINNEQRMQLRDLSKDWEEKIRYLEQRIKGMGIDKDRMEKELIVLSNKVTSANENFASELAHRKEDTQMEAKVRAEHTARVLETRLLGLQEGAEMMHRRGVVELGNYQNEEQKIFSEIQTLNQHKIHAEEENRRFDQAISDVKLHNEKLSNEELYLGNVIKKLRNEISLQTDELKKRNKIVKTNLEEIEKKHNVDERSLEDSKKDQDRKIQDLELRLKDLNSQLSSMDSKQSLYLDMVNRNVSKVVYETMINRNYIEN